ECVGSRGDRVGSPGREVSGTPSLNAGSHLQWNEAETTEETEPPVSEDRCRSADLPSCVGARPGLGRLHDLAPHPRIAISCINIALSTNAKSVEPRKGPGASVDRRRGPGKIHD